ncbi:MAG: HAMP domain-containing protein [Gammaproteobacteria bacterium]|nr:HAMP domain-containing protein [Gammaproteobacteria bacterium]MBU1647719.1 HAMP domain-containing protein [Gammaproteobacteria bacterium]MBU1971865.1 HAMP domain-containing protein [Gammaproteobacteria bacterium]
MGRLFWKFFFFFWVAQVLTSAGVGLTIWLQQPERNLAAGEFDHGPPRRGPSEWQHPPPPRPPQGRPPPAHSPMPLLPILSGSVVSVFFAALLAWYFAKPIRGLRTAFESVAAGRLQTRIGASMGNRNDELADLGSGFDRMANRLESLLEAQRRLLHDVSHELRSPLARLQAAADLVRQQPDRAAEFIERIERDTGRMDKLVGELLTLARLDSGMTGNIEEAVDLCDILADISDDAYFESEQKQCSMDLDIASALNVRGSHELLYRAIENVVRNAVLHSPQGGRISIFAQAKEGRVRMVVADNGAGVPESDLAAIFDPFVRSGSGRSPGGYGLGLAITRRIIEAHHGSVCAANGSEGGLVVVMELPEG